MGNAKVITVFSPKGGVGKSTSVRFLANILARDGKNVLVVDLCQNSSAAINFGGDRNKYIGKTIYEYIKRELKPKEVIQTSNTKGIWFIPSDHNVSKISNWINENVMLEKELSLEKVLAPLRKLFDYIIIDTHPDQTDLNAIMGLVCARTDGMILIPTFLDEESKLAAHQAAKIVRVNFPTVPYRILFTKVRQTNLQKSKSFIEEIKKDFSKDGITEFADVSVRETNVIPNSSLDKFSFDEISQNRYGKLVIDDYTSLLEEIKNVFSTKGVNA